MNEGRLIAALEFKSQVGPSFGNNANNAPRKLSAQRMISGPPTVKALSENRPGLCRLDDAA